jgi:hypothetical protein
MTDATAERDQLDEWRKANPEAALDEAMHVAIGCVLQYEQSETVRKAAINVLIACHRRAQEHMQALAVGRKLN